MKLRPVNRMNTSRVERLENRVLLSAAVLAGLSNTPPAMSTATILPDAQTAPGQPGGLTALWEGSRISVSWLAVNGATSYNIYRSTAPGGEGATPFASPIIPTNFFDTAVTAGQTYFYQVSAVASDGTEGLRSNEVKAVVGVDVLSYHGSSLDSAGVNSQEVQLTPGNVNVGTFGKNFATNITDVPNLDGIPTSTLNTSINYTAPDGQAYGEPLVKTNVPISTGPYNGTTHDVVFVANELGSLFAIDANGGNVLWKDSFIYNASGNPNPLNPTIPNGTTAIPGGYTTETNSQDISPWICIVGTPVIDPASNSIYLIANTRYVPGGPAGDQANPHYIYTIHKINLSNGQDTNSVFADTTLGYATPSNPTYTYNSGPYVLGTGEGAITVSGQSRVYFNAVRQMVRPAMEITQGRIFVSSASHGDNQPYHGWILTFDPSTLAINGTFNSTPNGVEGGIWSGGDGVVFDPQGNFYVETGNGTFDGNFTVTNGVTTYTGLTNGFPTKGDYGDCFVKLALDPTTTINNQNQNGWGIKVLDYFTPQNNQKLNSGDTDLGSGGPMILPASAGNPSHPLIVGAGKEGKIYLLDTTSLGKFTSTDSGALQEVGSAINGTLSTPAYFNGRLYYSPGYGGTVVSWALSGAKIDTTSKQSSPDSIAFPGSSPYISANGTLNGIVWVIDKGTGQLRAYDAGNLASELWTSNQSAARDSLPGGTVKFSVATPVNGRVYALSATSLVAYGPPAPPTAPPAAPTALGAVATGASTISLTWTDDSNNEDGFSIERSTDGSTFTPVGTVGVNITSYVDSGLNPQAKFYYRVRAYNSFNGGSDSAYTNIANATTLALGSQAPVDLYHFDENGGTAANDSAGINNGILVGATLPVWIAPGRVGTSALSFSGDGIAKQTTSESTVKVANNLAPILGGTSSIDVWIKTTQVGNNAHYLAPAITGVEQSGGGNDINWGYLDAAGHIGFFVGDSGGVLSSNPINNGQWHNVAMTRDAGTGRIQLYVDGVLNSSGTFDTGNKTSQFFLIGALSDVASDGVTSAGATYFNGQLDEVRIYNQVLDPDEISGLSLPPAAPTNLAVKPASGTELDLTWTDNSPFATGYVLQRSVNTGPWVSLPELPSGTISYHDIGLSPDAFYQYQIEAVDTAGASPFSNIASATTPIPPTTPTNATETLISTSEIDLKWTNTATNATGIRILRSVIGGEFVAIVNDLPPSATSYSDTGLPSGTEYDYHIQAYNVAGYSDFTGVHTGTISAAPADLQASAGNGQVTLSWTPPAYNGDGQNLTFNVYRGTASGAEAATPIATGLMLATFTDIGLVNGQTYFYTITATDLGGQSAPSPEASATPRVASIAGRFIFYNDSYFDGNDPAPGAADDGAIAPDKQALLPGQTATFANYTSYSKGINGIIVDIAGLPVNANLIPSDFAFKVGNTTDPSNWSSAPAPTSITIRTGQGTGGSDRVELIWPDGSIHLNWLQVTVLVTPNTGLAAADVFYFGNTPGESGDTPGFTYVDGNDFAGARDDPHNFLNRATITNPHDYNRDSFVDGTDLAIARDDATNFLTALKLITAPPPSAPAAIPTIAPAGAGAIVSSTSGPNAASKTTISKIVTTTKPPAVSKPPKRPKTPIVALHHNVFSSKRIVKRNLREREVSNAIMTASRIK